MSSKIDPRQVLSYLNQLGYTNIDANQLQAFIKDLKKLVKYEERQTNVEQVIKVNVLTESSMDFKTSTSLLDKYGESETGANIPTTNGLKSTHSDITTKNVEKENIPIKKKLPERPSTVPLRSSSKESTRPSSQSSIFRSNTIACPVHITCHGRPRPKSCTDANEKPQGRISCMKNKTKKSEKGPSCPLDVKPICPYPDSDDNLTYYSDYCPVRRKQTKTSGTLKNLTQHCTRSCTCPGSTRPKSSVIKCNIGYRPTLKKCDPVNLHKYYQRQWQINPIPGENMMKDQKFRWCFREKISCGPPVKK